MSTREFCVYNETRESFLAPRVTLLDTRSEPLKTVKVLIEGLAPNAKTGLWLNPLKSVPTVPRLSPYDLVYLDGDARVLHHLELVPDDEVSPFEGPAASVLLLPLHTVAASQIQPGDRVIVRPAGEAPSLPPTPALALPVPAALVPAASVAKLPPLAAPLAATHPIEVQPPAPASSRRFELLRSFARLRIHIQISITTTPPPAPGAHRAVPTLFAQRSLAHAKLALLRSHLSRFAAAASASLRARFTQTAAFLHRQSRFLSAAYLRWADAFVFGRAHTRPADRFPRLRRYILDSFFPR